MPSVGSCHDALTACEGCEQASEASPASRIFTALIESALADSPHFRHTNFAWVLRLFGATSGGGGASHRRGRSRLGPGRTARLRGSVRVAGFGRPSFLPARFVQPIQLGGS